MFPVLSGLIVATVVAALASRAAQLDVSVVEDHELSAADSAWARWLHLGVRCRAGLLRPTTAPDAEVNVFVSGSRSTDGERWMWTGGREVVTLRPQPTTVPLVIANIDDQTHTLDLGWQLGPRSCYKTPSADKHLGAVLPAVAGGSSYVLEVVISWTHNGFRHVEHEAFLELTSDAGGEPRIRRLNKRARTA